MGMNPRYEKAFQRAIDRASSPALDDVWKRDYTEVQLLELARLQADEAAARAEDETRMAEWKRLRGLYDDHVEAYRQAELAGFPRPDDFRDVGSWPGMPPLKPR